MDGADPGASSGSPPPGCRGAGAIAAAAGLATLVLLGTALAFGATHRVEAGQELIFSNLRLSNTSNASNGTAALVMDLQGGQMVVLQTGAFTKQDANLSALLAEGQLARVRLSSREVLLNFSFTAEGMPAIMDRFFFTIYFMARQRVQLANFSRFCWDLASSFEHSGHGLAKNKVVLEAAPDLKRFVPKDPRGIPEMQRAATFLLRSVDHFAVSVITEGDADGSDFYFSGQNVVSDICEEASSKRIHDGAMVEIVEGPYNGLRGIADINSGRFQVLLANGKHVQVGEMDCRLLEEDREAVDAELQAEQVEDKCATLYDAERACSEDGCEVLLIPEPALSCDKYCQAHGMHCHQAWRSKANSCGSRERLQCLAALPQNLRSEHQLRCRCQPAARSRLGQEVQADAHVMLLSGGAGVAIKAPDAEGAVQVQVPAVVTLHAPLFRKVEGKGKSRSVPCEELRQGDEVELTDGAFAHRKGALLRCDPVSKQYSVSLEKSLQVHAFDLQVLQCKASEQGASCSEDHCKVQPSKKESSSCADFCKRRGDRCLRAWEGSGCRQQRLLPCEHSGDVTGMICECVPVSHPGDCFQNDLSYRPVNMKLQHRSKERSALSCQRRCARVAGCSHFSYWSDGGCHLQDDDAQLSAEPGAVSGPPDCLTEQKTSTDSACREGLSFRPLDMHGHARSHEASAAQCALRCKSVEGCSHFSYWSDGGCHLQDSRAVNGPSHGAFSGPPNCPELATAEAKEKEAHQKLDKPESCNLVDVERYCPAASGCKALVSQMGHRSCLDYCEQQGFSCLAAFQDSCDGEEVRCDSLAGSRAVCACGSEPESKDEESWEFHCRKGQRGAWSAEKRWWCCRELQIGCEALQGCDPSDGYVAWEEERKAYCCREEGICSKDDQSYDCEQLQTSGVVEASEEMTNWCCTYRGTGCRLEEPEHCDDLDTEVEWSYEKREWCCREENIGCERLGAQKAPDTAAVGSVLSSLPIMVQYTAGHQWLPASRVSKAFRWLARTLGPAALGLLAGVAVLSLLQLLCKAGASGARDSLSFKDGYLRVATEEL